MNRIIENLIDSALDEDIGSGDITTENLIDPDLPGQGVLIAKEPLVLAGLGIAGKVFNRLDRHIRFQSEFVDGDNVETGQSVVSLEGRLGMLLKGERTALNFLQRLSGIATHVRSYVRLLEGLPVRLVDTRKTTPGWRVLEKYAVRVGGAYNHRMGLYDGVLIKDNHIAAFGSVADSIKHIRNRVSHLIKIEVEVTTLEETQEAVDAGADVIMLDNMDLDRIRAAVKLINKTAVVEVSGGVTHKNIKELTGTGVDVISVGALTHAARCVDISMQISN
jgi:nicotinate-nucleotide pyrophosphorylase (carboxylating)